MLSEYLGGGVGFGGVGYVRAEVVLAWLDGGSEGITSSPPQTTPNLINFAIETGSGEVACFIGGNKQLKESHRQRSNFQ